MALPANITTRTVVGTVVGFDGQPIAGTITFTLSTTLTNATANAFVVPSTVTATLDASGAFSVVLAATNDPDVAPSGFTYRVVENFTGGRTYTISVPESATNPVGLTDLMTAPTVTQTFTPVYRLRWTPLESTLTSTEASAASANQAAIVSTTAANVSAANASIATATATLAPVLTSPRLDLLLTL